MPQLSPLVWAWYVSAVIAASVFTLLPGLDLAASRVFWDGTAFPAGRSPVLEALRHSLWLSSQGLVLVALVGFGVCWVRRNAQIQSSARCWGFILCLFAVGPGLIVNAFLKSYWGRARPDQTDVFGGSQNFTPALWPTDQCSSNCSFVSGEAAAAMALAVSLLVIARRFYPSLRGPVIVAAVGITVVGGGLRLAAGRHFLSDVIFAWLIVGGVALLLHRWLLGDGLRLRWSRARAPEAMSEA